MSDVTQSQDAPTQTPLANDPTARTSEGTIKDQQASQTSSTPEPTKPASTEAPKPSVAADAKATPEGAPEKYEPFKAPEGFEIDAPTSEKASAVFRELGLSQAQAQKLVDFYAQTSADAAAEPYKQYETMRNGWRDQVVKDPTLGDGTGLRSEVKATIGRAVDSLPAEVARDFRAAMDLTGAGDNPAFIKAFYNLAQRLGEGTAVRSGAPAPVRAPGAAPKSAASALYPNLPSSSAS